MSVPRLRAADVFNFAAAAQGLGGLRDSSSNASAVHGIIRELGYVQIDTISVIRRAHHHTLWNRFRGYSDDILHRLQAKERRIFEYWGHAASYLPMEDYRFYIHRMNSFFDPKSKWVKNRYQAYGHLMDDVLERIRKEGPLGSRDFKSEKRVGQSAWGNWKPAKFVLELLFWRGELMVTRRENFHRIYDLTERVLPPGVDTTVPSEEELGRFLVRRALAVHGAALPGTIKDNIRSAGRDLIDRTLRDMQDAGEITAVSVDGKEGYYCLSGDIQELLAHNNPPETVRFLSPFDNLIIHRLRMKRLLGFDYALECYMPKRKRKYGYFVLPVLYRGDFPVRMDAAAKKGTLTVRNLVFREGFRDFQEFLPPFLKEMAAFARFNGCRRVVLEKVEPGGHSAVLKKEFGKLGSELCDDE